tara:strand:+ start:114 stop:275 length:162 start_codon:yes stop_codon:yes gene_type:complete
MDDNIKNKFKALKNVMIINLGYLSLVVEGIDNVKDKRLTSNKLKRKSWLRKLY